MFGNAGEVLKAPARITPVEAPPAGSRKIGGARAIAGGSSPTRDSNGKQARYKVGDVVRIKNFGEGWMRATVVKADVRAFMGSSVWHYKIKDDGDRVGAQDWVPQTLLDSAWGSKDDIEVKKKARRIWQWDGVCIVPPNSDFESSCSKP